MKKERTNLELRTIKRNDGQLEWLPRNPRQWTQTDIDNTARSIAEDEDFLEDRPLLVVPNGDEYIVFAGNLRREGAKKQKMKTVPAVVYHPETDEDRLTVKRRAMKDNGSYGAWDYDALANEWDDLPLADWGVPSWNDDEPEGPAGSIDIDGLFNPQESKPGGETDIQVVVSIPSDQADKEEDIRAAILVTLEQFPGVTVKQ